MAESETENHEDRYALELAETLPSLSCTAPLGLPTIWRIEPYGDPDIPKLSLDNRPRGKFEGDERNLKLRLLETRDIWKNTLYTDENPDREIRHLVTEIMNEAPGFDVGRIDRIFFIYIDSLLRPLQRSDPNRTSAESNIVQTSHELFAAAGIINEVRTYRNRKSNTSPLEVVFADPAYTDWDCKEIETFMMGYTKSKVEILATPDFQWLRTISEYRQKPLNALVVSFNPSGPIRRLLADIHRAIAGKQTNPYPQQPILSILCPRTSEFDPLDTRAKIYLKDFKEVELLPSLGFFPGKGIWKRHFGQLVWYALKDKEYHFEPNVRGLVRS